MLKKPTPSTIVAVSSGSVVDDIAMPLDAGQINKRCKNLELESKPELIWVPLCNIIYRYLGMYTYLIN